MDTERKLGKDEMLQMIQFGADKIFRSNESTITDEDIDIILTKGETKTQEMVEKLQEIKGEDGINFLQSFTFDTPTQSVSVFEGEDYSAKRKVKMMMMIIKKNKMVEKLEDGKKRRWKKKGGGSNR